MTNPADAAEQPDIFEVDEFNVILKKGFSIDETREYLYNLGRQDVETPSDLISTADGIPPLWDFLDELYTDARDTVPESVRTEQLWPANPYEGRVEWLERMSADEFTPIHGKVIEWLEEEPCWEIEDDFFVVDSSPHEAAFGFFESDIDGMEAADALKLNRIDGPMPGNSAQYYKATLSVEEMNEIAEAESFNIRFERAETS